MRVMVVHMMDTKLYFQCRRHRKPLIAEGPIMTSDGGEEYLKILWENFSCPKHPHKTEASCKRQWRVVVVESGQAVIK